MRHFAKTRGPFEPTTRACIILCTPRRTGLYEFWRVAATHAEIQLIREHVPPANGDYCKKQR